MEPFFRAGERVQIEPCGAAQLRRGDLVAFERDARVILHRVLHRDRGTDEVTEKGDNASLPTLVAPPRVLGRATMRLDPPRPLRIGPGLARLSALHGALHASIGRVAARYPRSRLGVLLRGIDGLMRALRRMPVW
jgi:hypothetical protein